jgi:glycosyltransferase involved in cell wall biosynthesis
MKIVCVIHALPIGGMERVMCILCNYFIAEKHNVDLILIGRNREIEYHLHQNVRVHKPLFEFNNNQRTISTLKTLFFLRRKVKILNPDCVLSFGEMWNNLVLLSLLGNKVPIYISDRSQPNKNLGKIHDFLRNILYPKARGFIAQTSYAKNNALKNKWSKNIKVIGNPIRRINNTNYNENANIILFVGRLLDSKNVQFLIRTFHELDLKNWKLIICGGNTQGKNQLLSLKNLCIDLNVSENVKLMGSVTEIDKYYEIASIFAFPSTSEGFPNALGEAIAAGIPSVAFDCIAGPSEMIVNEVNGLLVENNNFEQFKIALKRLVEDEDLKVYLSNNCNAQISKFYEENICVDFLNFIKIENNY